MIQGKEPRGSARGRLLSVSTDPFVSGFDMQLARPLARSIRLNGFATCLRLEQIYWDILGDMAQLNSCSVSTLLSHVDREVHLRHGGVRNFSGLVRVVCVVHSLKEAEIDQCMSGPLAKVGYACLE